MNEVFFEDFEFEPYEKGIKAWFYKNYYFVINKEELSFSEFKVQNRKLFFSCPEKVARKKMNILINKGIKNLRNRLRNKQTIFIDQDLGLPLIGSNDFGLIDRGTNIIEVKPVTGCNLGCVFCSISEGPNNKRDLLVELNYLVNGFKEISSIKKLPVEANIGPQGEPLLYPKIVELVSELKKIDNVQIISMNTNGLLLSEELIDDLAKAGLTRFNLSLHSLNEKKASSLAGSLYDVRRIKKLIKYCEDKIDVMITPLYIPSLNEELDDLLLFAKTIKNKSSPVVGVQNYLNYKHGRNIAEQKSWDFFYEFLEKKEKELDINLKLQTSTFKIEYDETPKKPFKKGQIIRAEIICNARNKNEFYASSHNRCITLINPKKNKGIINAKIVRDKHNIFLAS